MQSYTHFFWLSYKIYSVFSEAHNFVQLCVSSKNPFWMNMNNLHTTILSPSSPSSMIIVVSLYLFCFIFNSFYCWILLDVILPFPVLFMTIVAIVVSSCSFWRTRMQNNDATGKTLCGDTAGTERTK